MKCFGPGFATILIGLLVGSSLAQRAAPLAENAALRYWSAFSEVQDVSLTDQQAQELNAILDGTAPFDDLRYKVLLEKNALALEIMARATALPSCEWGLDYGLGRDVPVNYARKALFLDDSTYYTPCTCSRTARLTMPFVPWQRDCAFRMM